MIKSRHYIIVGVDVGLDASSASVDTHADAQPVHCEVANNLVSGDTYDISLQCTLHIALHNLVTVLYTFVHCNLATFSDTQSPRLPQQGNQNSCIGKSFCMWNSGAVFKAGTSISPSPSQPPGGKFAPGRYNTLE